MEDVGLRYRFSGCKPKQLPDCRKPLGEVNVKRPDLTLTELRD